jgi:hypothetical protein
MCFDIFSAAEDAECGFSRFGLDQSGEDVDGNGHHHPHQMFGNGAHHESPTTIRQKPFKLSHNPVTSAQYQ